MTAPKHSRATLIATFVATIALLAPAAALASGGGQIGPQPGSLAPGVHVDPGSPAGKQYQFPIGAARSETSGGQTADSSVAPPLFGVGIAPSRAGRAGAGHSRSSKHNRRGSRSSAGGSTAGGSGHGSGSSAGNGSRGAIPSLGSPTASAVGGSGWLALVGGGALVFVLGGGGGLALRRRLLS